MGGDFGLVVIDTGPVFYEGDDENSRKQQGRHAVSYGAHYSYSRQTRSHRQLPPGQECRLG